MPASVVVILAILAFAIICESPLQTVRTSISAGAAATYVSNLHFYRLASDYFSGGVKSDPTLHMWSLSVEEQLYLVWPWALLLFHRSKSPMSSRRRMVWGLTAIGVVSFVASSWLTNDNRTLAFYAMPLRAWEFVVGGLAASLRLGLSSARLAETVGRWRGWTPADRFMPAVIRFLAYDPRPTAVTTGERVSHERIARGGWPSRRESMRRPFAASRRTDRGLLAGPFTRF